MKSAHKISELNTFLDKVRRLRGYGDMDSYLLVSQIRGMSELIPDTEINTIIQDFSSPFTYGEAKNRLTHDVETLIGEALNS